MPGHQVLTCELHFQAGLEAQALFPSTGCPMSYGPWLWSGPSLEINFARKTSPAATAFNNTAPRVAWTRSSSTTVKWRSLKAAMIYSEDSNCLKRSYEINNKTSFLNTLHIYESNRCDRNPKLSLKIKVGHVHFFHQKSLRQNIQQIDCWQNFLTYFWRASKT